MHVPQSYSDVRVFPFEEDPHSIFPIYLLTDYLTSNLGYLFLTEFFVDSYIGIVIWACLDPANPFVAATSAPFAIGLAYATMVWGFADIAISTNLARDLGTRIVAAIFFGGEAFSYLNYSWIAILVNVPATLFATAYYEFLMRDSLSKIAKGHALHEHGEEGLHRHITRTVSLLLFTKPPSPKLFTIHSPNPNTN